MKRSKSAYQYFCDDMRPIVKKDNPGIKPSDTLKELARLWRIINIDDKSKYIALAAAGKCLKKGGLRLCKCPECNGTCMVGDCWATQSMCEGCCVGDTGECRWCAKCEGKCI